MPLLLNPWHSQETLAQYKSSLKANENHREMMNVIGNNYAKSEKSRQLYLQATSVEFDKIRKEQHQNTLDIVASNEAINYTLENGFDRVDESLQEMGETLYSINSTLGSIDASLEIMITQFRISNLLQENIAELLRIPDSEKERQSYLENALKHISNGLFSDALENLLYVEKIKTIKGLKEDNFIVLFHIGFLLLYRSELLDVDKAFQYFEKTCKYALAETDEHAIRLANILVGSPSEQRLSENIPTTSNMKKISAEYCYHTAFAAYLLGKFDKSIEYCKKTVQLDPNYFSKAGFLQAKSMLVNKETQLAITVLDPVLRKEPEYSIQASLDGDLCSKIEVKTLLLKLRDEYVKNAKEQLEKLEIDLKKVYNKYDSLMTNELKTKFIKPIKNKISEINNLINKNTFLDASYAIQMIKENELEKKINEFEQFKNLIFELNIKMRNFKNEYPIYWFPTPENENEINNIMEKANILVNEDYGESLKLYVNCIKLFESYTRNIVIWETKKSNYDCSYSVSFSPDGEHIVSGGKDCTVRLWNSQNGKEIWKSKKNEYVDSVSFSPDGKYIVSGIRNSNIVLWNSQNGEEIWKKEAYYSGEKSYNSCRISAIFSPDGKHIVSCSSDHHIRLWNSRNGKEIWKAKRSEGVVSSVSFSPDGKYIVSGGSYVDNVICSNVILWNSQNGEEIWKKEDNEGSIRTVCFSPDGKYIVSDYISGGSNVILWNSQNGKEIWKSKKNEYYVDSVSFSPDGKYIVAAYRRSLKLILIFPITKKEIKEIKEEQKKFRLKNKLCLECGVKLSFWEKLNNKEKCKNCI